MKTIIFTILISLLFIACAEKDKRIEQRECLNKGKIFLKIKYFNWRLGKEEFKYECR